MSKCSRSLPGSADDPNNFLTSCGVLCREQKGHIVKVGTDSVKLVVKMLVRQGQGRETREDAACRKLREKDLCSCPVVGTLHGVGSINGEEATYWFRPTE